MLPLQFLCLAIAPYSPMSSTSWSSPGRVQNVESKRGRLAVPNPASLFYCTDPPYHASPLPQKGLLSLPTRKTAWTLPAYRLQTPEKNPRHARTTRNATMHLPRRSADSPLSIGSSHKLVGKYASFLFKYRGPNAASFPEVHP